MYPEFIFMAISGGFIVMGAIILRDGGFIFPYGKKADAVIFKNNFSTSGSDGGTYYPVVKFLTDKQEWITQEMRDGFNPPIPEGTKVEVLYDPENPTDVAINSSIRLRILPTIFIVLGAIGMALSILGYMGVLNFG
ncbi:MAG: DUF3592 domain-containing protein [Chryseolinea sp.]